jgi:hypothetical protein
VVEPPASQAGKQIRDRRHHESGGADRDRTDDLKLAKLALSQLSYGPDHRAHAKRHGSDRSIFEKGYADGGSDELPHLSHVNLSGSNLVVSKAEEVVRPCPRLP